METESSVLCVVECAATEAISNNNGSRGISSSLNNNNNVAINTDCNQQSSNTTNNKVEDDETTSAKGSSMKAVATNCDNGDSAVAVAFAEIHLNNNESIIGFVDDEDEAAVGETIATAANDTETDEGACCKPDANNCGIDAVVEDGKHFCERARTVNLFLV